jgi:hypothetical protein
VILSTGSNMFMTGRLIPIENVGKASYQPGLSTPIVVLAPNRFTQHVRVLASKAKDLPLQADADLRHQIGKALIS